MSYVDCQYIYQNTLFKKTPLLLLIHLSFPMEFSFLFSFDFMPWSKNFGIIEWNIELQTNSFYLLQNIHVIAPIFCPERSWCNKFFYYYLKSVTFNRTVNYKNKKQSRPSIIKLGHFLSVGIAQIFVETRFGFLETQ